MGLFRIRRNVRLLPGAILSANAPHAGGGWRERHSVPSRNLMRTLPTAADPAGRPGASGAPLGPVLRKRPATAVPLLVGAVFVLWFLLALSGHI